MNPTAGSFVVNERVTRHFAMFSCLMPSVSDVKIIYKSILDDHFRKMDDGIRWVPVLQHSSDINTRCFHLFFFPWRTHV
jgi:hypothetical protein